MKIHIQILTFLMVFGLLSGTVNASGNKEGLDDQQSQTAFSARQYCRSSGGRVTETDNRNIYLCCYAKKNKCIVSDSSKTVSWSIPYEGQAWTPAQIKAQLLQLLDVTDTFPGTKTLARLERDGQ